MNNKQMKYLKHCFGNIKCFFKSKIKECVDCPFKQKCLIEVDRKKRVSQKNSKKGLST